jgi:hypothetical protein
MYRTFYNTITGKISICRKISESDANKRIANIPNESYINVACRDVNNYRVNTETLQLEQIVTVKEYTEWMRQRRNIKLSECDWTQGADSPLTAEKKAEWATYRQALRDMPTEYTTISNREDVVWPTPPGA